MPLRKPTPPRPATVVTAPQAVPEPAPPAAPPEQTASLPPPEPVGMTERALADAFGQPAARRDSPPAVVWQYVDGDCSLDVYLYRDVQTDALHALYVELDGNDRSDQRRQFCLRRLVQRPDRIGG
ncbi:MAG TPA: hypothetical protein VKS60_18665 [Stellaceae bacterium]|nr:hypothetical protein [Stellaceae bacterium]